MRQPYKDELSADLPATQDQLFRLDEFPLLDIKNAIESIGSESMLREILLIMNKNIHYDSKALEDAYAEQNWETVEKLAHKMKGGALYSGVVKMRYACQYLERSQKAGYTALRDKLYHQLIQVLDETKQCIEQWAKQ